MSFYSGAVKLQRIPVHHLHHNRADVRECHIFHELQRAGLHFVHPILGCVYYSRRLHDLLRVVPPPALYHNIQAGAKHSAASMLGQRTVFIGQNSGQGLQYELLSWGGGNGEN